MTDSTVLDAVVHIPPERVCQNDSRGATRMGGSDVQLMPGLLRSIYGTDVVHERHSNRYEVDGRYVDALDAHGLALVGVSTEGKFAEAFELRGHPFYVAVVYHPEYQSRPNHPHPLVRALLAATKNR